MRPAAFLIWNDSPCYSSLPRLGKGSGDLGDQASSAGSTGSPFHSAIASLFFASQIRAPQCLPPYLWSRGLGKSHRGHGNNLSCIDHTQDERLRHTAPSSRRRARCPTPPAKLSFENVGPDLLRWPANLFRNLKHVATAEALPSRIALCPGVIIRPIERRTPPFWGGVRIVRFASGGASSYAC